MVARASLRAKTLAIFVKTVIVSAMLFRVPSYMCEAIDRELSEALSMHNISCC